VPTRSRFGSADLRMTILGRASKRNCPVCPRFPSAASPMILAQTNEFARQGAFFLFSAASRQKSVLGNIGKQPVGHQRGGRRAATRGERARIADAHELSIRYQSIQSWNISLEE